MKLLEINLATRPLRNNSLYWAGLGSAAVILAGLTALNFYLFLGYGASMRQHRQDLEVKQQRREQFTRDEQRLSAKLARLDFKGLAVQAEFANDAIRRRVFSWTELFNRLEEVVPATVMMSAIRPEIQAEGIAIIIEGSAKDQGALLDFESNLIASAHFARIYPGSERREQRDQDLRFSLRCDYLPEGRPGVPPVPVRRPPEVKAEEKMPAPAPVPVASPGPPAGRTGVPVASGIPAPGGATPLRPSLPGPTMPATQTPGAASSPGGPGGTAATAPTVPPPSPSPTGKPPAATASPPARPSPAVPAPGPARMSPRRDPLRPRPGRGSRLAPFGQSVMYQPPAPDPQANFVNAPFADVLDYLTNKRKLTFVFASDFDLSQRVTVDLSGKQEPELVAFVAATLDCKINREAEHVYQVLPRSGGEPLEEPPVEEEPVPDNPEDQPEKNPEENPPDSENPS